MPQALRMPDVSPSPLTRPAKAPGTSRRRWIGPGCRSTVRALLLAPILWTAAQGAAGEPLKLTIDWSKTTAISRAAVSIQVCPEPPLLRGRPLHDRLFSLLNTLGADYPRLQPWFAYPRIGVAELSPPAGGSTHWDFTLLDQITADFIRSTAGHPVIVNYGAWPIWMFKGTESVHVARPVDDINWLYATGTEFRDSTLEEAADYQLRLASWYLKGGFRDENGRWHPSGHHYRFAYWEVGNEPDLEHQLSPAEYTRLYDRVVAKIRSLGTGVKFAGPSVSNSLTNAQFLAYFLDPHNHQPGTPIDLITYHFYTLPDRDETLADMQYTMFAKVEELLTATRYIDALRDKFVPGAKVAIDELGSMLPDPTAPVLTKPIPAAYWNLSAAMWAYAYGNLAAMDVDVVSGAELIDYPGQVASTTLADWRTGAPNARFLTLKLLRDNFAPGDRIVTPVWQTQTIPGVRNVYAQGFVGRSGSRKLLLVNKRARPADVLIPGALGGTQATVDLGATESPRSLPLTGDVVHLDGFAVAVITLP